MSALSVMPLVCTALQDYADLVTEKELSLLHYQFLHKTTRIFFSFTSPVCQYWTQLNWIVALRWFGAELTHFFLPYWFFGISYLCLAITFSFYLYFSAYCTVEYKSVFGPVLKNVQHMFQFTFNMVACLVQSLHTAKNVYVCSAIQQNPHFIISWPPLVQILFIAVQYLYALTLQLIKIPQPTP